MPNDWDIEDGNDSDDGDGANKSFKDLRNYAKKLEREQKAAAAELEELRTFKTTVIETQKEGALTSAFKEVGLPETHAKLFKALNPELEVDAITPETVFKFAQEYQLVPAEAQAPAAAEPKDEGFTPVTIGQPSPLKTYTHEELQTLIREGNVEEANRAVKEGRVEKISAPWAR